MNETSNVNGFCTHCKRRSKQNFNSVCIGFEKLNISFKITNHLEISKRCGRIGEKNFQYCWGNGNVRKGYRLK